MPAEILSVITEYKNAAIKKNKELGTELTEIDRWIVQYYHIIELVNLSAVDISKLTKTLKAKLQRRREIKEGLIMINNIINQNKNDMKRELERSVERTNNYRNESFDRWLAIKDTL